MRNILYVENRHFVGVREFGIKATNIIDKTEHFFAYEDVDVIIFDNAKSYFSERLIINCVKHNIAVLFCDFSHSPLLLLDNIYGQSKRFEVLKAQLDCSAKTKARLWRKIVKKKIENQAINLERQEKMAESKKLFKLISDITEGDHSNAEAYAAKIYFKGLFGDDFRRGRYDDSANSSLNYGYAILRMLIRREIVNHGLEPSFGIKHASTENPFNLSDDLIETFRPFLDSWVIENVLPNMEGEKLGILDKQQIIRILLQKCIIDGKVQYVGDAIKVMVNSYVHCVTTNSTSNFKLPSFIEGGK